MKIPIAPKPEDNILEPYWCLGVLFGLALNLLWSGNSSAQGYLAYQNALGLADRPIYGVDPAAPHLEVHGNDRSLYINRSPLSGASYYAELWYSPERFAAPESLTPVPGSLVTFRHSGLFNGISRLTIPDTFGGDRVTFQMRAWDNRNGSLSSWEQVMGDPTVPRGASNIISDWELHGVDANGGVHAGSGLIGIGMESFALFVVPEPSGLVLAGFLGLAFLLCKPNSG